MTKRLNIKPTQTLYSEFQNAYSVFNKELFGNKLPDCLITLQRRDSRSSGYFSKNRFGARIKGAKQTHEIALNPIRFKVDGPLEALQTLVHEMVHLWQWEFGEMKSTAAYHNAEWGAKMEEIGLMPSNTGKPGGARTGQQMADYPIKGGKFRKVAKALMVARFKLAWYDQGAAAFNLVPVDVLTALLNTDANGALAALPVAKSKIKYSCPCCKANAWGKPDLRIHCDNGHTMERMKPK